jgi:hypothetical protein
MAPTRVHTRNATSTSGARPTPYKHQVRWIAAGQNLSRANLVRAVQRSPRMHRQRIRQEDATRSFLLGVQCRQPGVAGSSLSPESEGTKAVVGLDDRTHGITRRGCARRRPRGAHFDRACMASAICGTSCVDGACAWRRSASAPLTSPPAWINTSASLHKHVDCARGSNLRRASMSSMCRNPLRVPCSQPAASNLERLLPWRAAAVAFRVLWHQRTCVLSMQHASFVPTWKPRGKAWKKALSFDRQQQRHAP